MLLRHPRPFFAYMFDSLFLFFFFPELFLSNKTMSKTADQWKAEGNAFLQAKQFDEAIEAYSQVRSDTFLFKALSLRFSRLFFLLFFFFSISPHSPSVHVYIGH